MQWKNTETEYGFVSKMLHWVTALAIIGLLAVGHYMTGLENAPSKFEIYGLHKSVGILVLGLFALRFIWFFVSPPPPLPEHYKKRDKLAAKGAHFMLYGFMLMLPLTGWLMSSGFGFPVKVFGMGPLPSLIEQNKEFGELMEEVHDLGQWALIALLLLHIAGGIKHKMLYRMAPHGKKAGLVATLLLMSATPAIAEPAVPMWQVETGKVIFNATQMGAPISGEIPVGAVEIIFDPEMLETASVKADIDVLKVDTKYADRDKTLKGSDWLAVDQFPVISFESTDFSHVSDNQYLAKGQLSIRDVKMDFDLPFTLDITEGKAEMSATFDFDRSQWKLGRGEWEDVSIIGQNVGIEIRLTASKK